MKKAVDFGNDMEIGTTKFVRILTNFLVGSEILDHLSEKYRNIVCKDYIDYFLIHSDEFDKEQLVDIIQLCRSYRYLNEFIHNEKNYPRTVTSEDVLEAVHADILLNYQYHNPTYRKWQEKLFKLLTFQDLY